MRAPAAMLSTPAPSWPTGDDWVLEPKYDGYRLLIQTTTARPRAWSRHGTSLTEALGDLLVAFADLPAGCVIDSELIALADVDGARSQDFAAFGRAVFGRDGAARQRLHIVAFDLPAHPSVHPAHLRDDHRLWPRSLHAVALGSRTPAAGRRGADRLSRPVLQPQSASQRRTSDR